MISGAVFLSIVVLALLGVPIARKFLRGLVRPANLYVLFDLHGKTLVYKNPRRPFVALDEPMETVPHEILTSDRYETYYNVYWFEAVGTLKRCGHSYHRTAENAAYCKLNGTPHSFVGKILEER